MSWLLDERWVTASISPLAEAQQFAIVWMQDYFRKFGDCAPNRYETFLIITARKVVYNQYKQQMIRQNRAPVQESVFSNLWVTVFPRYMNRPWCDIPGMYITLLFIIYYEEYYCCSLVCTYRYLWHLLWDRYSSAIKSWLRNAGAAKKSASSSSRGLVQSWTVEI